MRDLTANLERDASRPRLSGASNRWIGRNELQAPALASDPRGPKASRLFRDPRRELHGRRRSASSRPRDHPSRPRRFAAWRVHVDRRPARPGQGASRALRRARSALRAGARLRASGVVDLRERLFQRPAAAALHGSDARDGVRSHRRGAGGHRPAAAARKSVDLCPVPRIDDERDGFHPRHRAAHRLRPAARRQQCLRVGDQPRLLAARVSGRLSARRGRRNSSCGTRRAERRRGGDRCSSTATTDPSRTRFGACSRASSPERGRSRR